MLCAISFKLCAVEFFVKPVGFVCAIQDYVVATRVYKNLIVKERVKNA